jgi:phosphatidylserine/phosphatidylglycerophosphate/cardiolipin synthase-like enzyme
VDEVTSAKDSVDIRAYIFDNDDFAITIAELLKRRSREGIDTRVLFDGLGTIMAGAKHANSLPEGHRPPFSIRQHLQQDSRIQVRAVNNTWLMGDQKTSVRLEVTHLRAPCPAVFKVVSIAGIGYG